MSWNIPPELSINTWVPHCETCEEGFPDEDGDCQQCGEPIDMEPPEPQHEDI